MPGIYFWKKNLDSVYLEINESCAELFGFAKNIDIVGFTDDEIPCKISEFADSYRHQDQCVISTGEPLKILEIHPDAKKEWRLMFNTKTPLYEDGKITGTFAYCIDMTYQLGSLVKLLSTKQVPLTINNNLTQSSYILTPPSFDKKLSPRESECMFYLLRGKTSKQIAEILNLSARTVEQYVNSLKNKLSCSTKSDLISKMLDLGLMNILPPTLFSGGLSLRSLAF